MSKTSSISHKLAFMGAGYVGLVSGTCLAEIGHTVILVDKNEAKVKMLEAGKIPIFEPGLDELVLKNVKAGRLSFTTDISQAVKNSDVIFIAVATPPDEKGHADLSFVETATKEIAEHADTYKVVVNKSTVPVTTGEMVDKLLHTHNKHGVDFDVVSNPEFLREGSAISDFMDGDRVVIGVSNERAKKIMTEIYESIEQPLFFTDVKSAELIKYSSNSFLATKISFINAVASVCEATGANIDDVAEGIGLDKRIGKKFLNAGIGYGGSCFPKDVSAYIAIAQKHGYEFNLLKEVEHINEEARRVFIKKIEHALGDNTEGKTIGMWGLAFKPNTDDMRSAPSITIAEKLHTEGVTIKAFDPEATETAKIVLEDKVEYMDDMYKAIEGADALVIVTEWDVFKNADWEKVRGLLKNPIILDGRNMFKPQDMEKLGFVYHSVGRG